MAGLQLRAACGVSGLQTRKKLIRHTWVRRCLFVLSRALAHLPNLYCEAAPKSWTDAGGVMKGLHRWRTSFWSSARAPGARTLRRVLPEMASLHGRLPSHMRTHNLLHP